MYVHTYVYSILRVGTVNNLNCNYIIKNVIIMLMICGDESIIEYIFKVN